LAGFADGAAASKVLAARQTWATLARAQASEAGGHPLAVQLRRAWFRAARAEVKARREARIWTRTTAARGARRAAALRPVGVKLAGNAGMLVRDWRGSVAPPVPRRAGKLAVDIGAAARRALDAREQSARATSGAAARLRAFAARAAHDWQAATRGLRRGILRG
jgi:hypothetical protein